MHGPTGTTPGELAARSLSLRARMFLPCITWVLKPDQAIYRADPRWGGESAVAANFDRGYEPPIKTPNDGGSESRNLHRDLSMYIIYIPN